MPQGADEAAGNRQHHPRRASNPRGSAGKNVRIRVGWGEGRAYRDTAIHLAGGLPERILPAGGGGELGRRCRIGSVRRAAHRHEVNGVRSDRRGKTR